MMVRKEYLAPESEAVAVALEYRVNASPEHVIKRTGGSIEDLQYEDL